MEISERVIRDLMYYTNEISKSEKWLFPDARMPLEAEHLMDCIWDRWDLIEHIVESTIDDARVVEALTEQILS